MIIGFTGTQDGMTPLQYARVWHDLDEVGGPTLIGHHGDCIGADTQFHRIVRLCGGLISRHPPDDPKKRAFLDYDWDYLPLPYLERNHGIVVASEALIATPATDVEVPTLRHLGDDPLRPQDPPTQDPGRQPRRLDEHRMEHTVVKSIYVTTIVITALLAVSVIITALLAIWGNDDRWANTAICSA